MMHKRLIVVMMTLILLLVSCSIYPRGITQPNTTSTPIKPAEKLQDEVLAQYLLGTWVIEEKQDDVISLGEQTFSDDYTFFGSVRILGRVDGKIQLLKEVKFHGTWHVDRDVSLETADYASDPNIPINDPMSYRITDIKPDEHRSTNVKTGETAVYRRKGGTNKD